MNDRPTLELRPHHLARLLGILSALPALYIFGVEGVTTEVEYDPVQGSADSSNNLGAQLGRAAIWIVLAVGFAVAEWFTRTRNAAWPAQIQQQLVRGGLAQPGELRGTTRPLQSTGAPSFNLRPHHVARIGAGLAVLFFLLDPPGISWLIVAALCLVVEWQTRTRDIPWPTGARDLLVRCRLAADPSAAALAVRTPETVPGPRRIDSTAPVIPIRPLSVGEIFAGAFRATRRNWRVPIGFTAVALIGALALTALAANVALRVASSAAKGSTGADTFDALVAHLIVAFIVIAALIVVIGVPVDAAINGVTVITADRAIRGSTVRLAEVFTQIRPRLGALCRLMITLYFLLVLPAWLIPFLAVMAGGFTAAAVVMPVLFAAEFALGILFGLSPIVMTLEGTGVASSLKRSAALAKPAFWRLLGLHLLWAVFAVAALAVTYSPIGLLSVAFPEGTLLLPVYLVVFLAVMVPLFRTVQTLIYTDLRIREGSYGDGLIHDRAINATAPAPERSNPPLAAGELPVLQPRPASRPSVAPLFDLQPYHAARIVVALACIPVLADPPGIPWLIIVAGSVLAERHTRTKRVAWTPAVHAFLAQLRLSGPVTPIDSGATDSRPLGGPVAPLSGATDVPVEDALAAQPAPPAPLIPRAPVSLEKRRPVALDERNTPALASPSPSTTSHVDTLAATHPGPARKRNQRHLVAAAVLGTVATLVLATGTAWWFTHRDTNTASASAHGLLRYTFPEKPSTRWTIDAPALFNGAEFAVPIDTPLGSRPGFVDLGDVLVTTAILPQSDRPAELVAINSDTGEIEWRTEIGFHVSCASQTIDNLLPCFATHGYVEGYVASVAFFNMSDGSVDHRLRASEIERVEVVDNDIITAGYKGISRGTTDDLTARWTTKWESNNSCPGSGDAEYFNATDEFVHFGTDAGGLVVRANDGKQVIGSDAREIAIYPGHGLVAETCPDDAYLDREIMVLDNAGNLLRTHEGGDGFTAPLSVGEMPNNYVLDGTAYDFSDGSQAWSFGGGVADVIDNTVLMISDGYLSAVDFETGNVRWAHRFDFDDSYTVPYMWLTDRERAIFTKDDTLHAVNLGTGATEWSMPIGGTSPLRAGDGFAVGTEDSITFYGPTGGPAVTPASRLSERELDNDETHLVTKCGKTPEATPVEYRTDSDGLVVRMELRARCSSGDIISTDAMQVTITDSGQPIAAGVFDFSDSPLYLPTDDQDNVASTEYEFRFPVGYFWRLPNSIGSENDPGLQSVGGGRNQLVDCVDVGTSRGPHEGYPPAANVSAATVAATRGVPAASIDPEAAALDALRAQANADRPSVQRDVSDSWLPQLSSKRVGLVAPDVDGRMVTWSATEILNQHLRMRLQYPEVRLVWSDEWRSYDLRGWWVTIAGVTFAIPDSANEWCDSRGIAVDECYAKLISNTRDSEGTTKYRR